MVDSAHRIPQGPLSQWGRGLASETAPGRPPPHSLTPLLFKLGGDLSMKKLMAGEIEEKNSDIFFDSLFFGGAYTNIGWSLSLTRRWDLRKAGLFHKHMSL